MGLFDKIKKPKASVMPRCSRVMELIFCPVQNLEDIMGRLEVAFCLERGGIGNRITLYNGDMEIAFTSFVADKGTEDGKKVQQQLQEVWAYYRQTKTEQVDIQRNLLYHLGQCKGMVEVNATYDGTQNADKEKAILAQMGVAAEALQGVMTWGMDALVNSRGQIILDKKGHSDLDYYMPLELQPAEDIWKDAPQEAQERRNQSLILLRNSHIYVSPWLPLLDEQSQELGRTLEEVCGRAAALLVVSLYSECRLGEKMSYEKAKEFVAPIMEGYGTEKYFSPKEKEYLDGPDSTQQTQIQYAWQYENLWVMEWALGLTNDLFWPDHICDVPGSVRMMKKYPDMATLTAAAKLRPRSGLLQQADLIYCLHWTCVDAQVMGMPAPQKVESGVVMERHRALFWLAGCDNMCPWDDVDLST